MRKKRKRKRDADSRVEKRGRAHDRGCIDGTSELDGGLQLFASDIDDREGGGDAIKRDGKRG